LAKLEEWSYTAGKSATVVTTATVVETAEAKARRWAKQDYTSEEWLAMMKTYEAWALATGMDGDGGIGAGELGL
jgi:hypothetical protein